MAFRCRPVFIVVAGLHFYFFFGRNSQELSNCKEGGSLVCIIPLCRFLNLPITFCSYKKLAIFAANIHKKHTLQTYNKLSYEALSRQFLVGAVIAGFIHSLLL